MIRITWPAARWPKAPRRPTLVSCNIQRLCGHYERLPMLARRGWAREILYEEKKLCAACAAEHTPHTLLASEPRLRIHCEAGIWGVERLMANTLRYEIVAFLSSFDECLDWIAATFTDRHYQIVEFPPGVKPSWLPR